MKAEEVVAETRAWLDGTVIGLNLCPFAREVRDAGRIRFVVSGAETAPALRADLVVELRLLGTLDPLDTDTTLLIHPRVLADFLDYNDFLGTADDAIEELGMSGTFQIASFHPRYQFAGVKADDPANRSNRSPHPMLQLLREASVRRALEGYPGDPAEIPRRNIERLRREAE